MPVSTTTQAIPLSRCVAAAKQQHKQQMMDQFTHMGATPFAQTRGIPLRPADETHAAPFVSVRRVVGFIRERRARKLLFVLSPSPPSTGFAVARRGYRQRERQEPRRRYSP